MMGKKKSLLNQKAIETLIDRGYLYFTHKNTQYMAEINPVTTKKLLPIYIERDMPFMKLMSIKNLKGEWLNFSIPRNNPNLVVMSVVGGVHRINFSMPITELENLKKLWKWKYTDVFGVEPRIPRKKTLERILKARKARHLLKVCGY